MLGKYHKNAFFKTIIAKLVDSIMIKSICYKIIIVAQ